MNQAPRPPLDPVYRHARREALVILSFWAACLAWTVGYCALAGYPGSDAAVAIVWGMPQWVAWGVLFPWLAASAFSIVYSLWGMADDDLGEGETDGEGNRTDA